MVLPSAAKARSRRVYVPAAARQSPEKRRNQVTKIAAESSVQVGWGQMLLQRHFRSGSSRRIWVRTVLASVALLAVLTARNVASDFSKAPSVHTTISAKSQPDPRSRFDDSGLKWKAPANRFELLPPSAESAHIAPMPQLFSGLQAKGFHFNRPPPIS